MPTHKYSSLQIYRPSATPEYIVCFQIRYFFSFQTNTQTVKRGQTQSFNVFVVQDVSRWIVIWVMTDRFCLKIIFLSIRPKSLILLLSFHLETVRQKDNTYNGNHKMNQKDMKLTFKLKIVFLSYSRIHTQGRRKVWKSVGGRDSNSILK